MTDYEYMRMPPASSEAERAVLGALLFDDRCLPRVAMRLGEDDFYRADHRMIFRAICELADKHLPFDAVTLGEWFEAKGLSEQVGGMAAMIDLAATAYTAANVVAHADIVRSKALLRRVIEVGTELVNAGFDPGEASATDIIADTASKLAKLVPTSAIGALTPRESMRLWFQSLQERVAAGAALVGLPTPWAALNALTGGLRPGRLYVVAGRPAMGKSVIGGQLASFAALRGVRTAMFSLEMTDGEVRDRNVAALGNVPYAWLQSPTEDSDYWPAVSNAVKDLSAAPLLIDDTPSLTASQVCYRANAQHMESPLGLVVVDHLHEMKVDPKDRVNALGDAARALKALAKTLNLPVVCLAQLNRGVTGRESKRPTMADLRASGSIEEVADVVLLLHREDYYTPDTYLAGALEVIVGKGRNIRSGDTLMLAQRFDVMRADDWVGDFPRPPEPAEGRKPSRWKSGAKWTDGARQ